MGADDYKYGDPFKFKSLLIYSSSEWMAHSKRKYRRVFDKSEVSYIRSEFTFYNKLFDEEDWKAKVTVKFFQIKRGKRDEIASLDEDVDETQYHKKEIQRIFELIARDLISPKEYARMKEEYSIEQLQLDKFEKGRLAEKKEIARNLLAEGIAPE